MKYFFSIGAIGSLLFFICSHTVLAAPPSVVITQLQISGVKADDEFIRLKNETSADINLSGFRLSKKALSAGVCKESSLVSIAHFQGLLPADDTFLIAHPAYKDLYGADLDYSSASYYLSGNTVVLLYDQSGTLLDRKVSGTACDVPLPEPTPPAPNPIPIPPIPDPIPETPPPPLISVRLNEILPNPVGNENEEEFIELWNDAPDEANISNFVLRDASRTGAYTLPQGTTIAGRSYFVLKRGVSKLSLNNSNETLSLFDTANTLVDTLSYTKTKEGVSLNVTENGWRGGVPTPGTKNIPNILPETREKVPKKGYRDVSVAFDARGRDTDGGSLKYVWDFGDSHKSYKEKTSHTYEENGTYQVTLTTTDGSDDVTETFTLKIESMPKPDVRITKMIPNPSGKDTESEWIMIENRGKKSIDLKGFGIATGWKKLVNHPIRESFIIKPKETVKLTREFSLFTLPNQKGKIELRAPDGKVLQKIKYKLSEAAEEDAVYGKQKGKRWEWQESAETETTQEKSPLPPLTETVPKDSITPPVEPTIAPERVPEDPLQEEPPKEEDSTPPESSEVIEEKQVLGAETTVAEKSPEYFPPVSPLSTKEYPFVVFFRNFFMNLNARLNDWQNGQEQIP